MTHKQQKPEILFLQDCSLLPTSAVGLMLLHPEPPFHLDSHCITSYLSLLVGSDVFQLPKVLIVDLKSKWVLFLGMRDFV